MKKIICITMMLLYLTGCTNNKMNAIDNQNSSIYYEIFVGSFCDSDDDGIGDIQGIISKLDYLESLGVKGIWLTPIHPSESYHKYDVLNYMEIDSTFGTMEDFEQLVSEMKIRNMDLIMDLVINHTSSNHPWFVEAKKNILNNACDRENGKCDYYNFYDSKKSNSTKLSNNIYYESVFSDKMPDLNLDNQEVRQEIKDIVTFWLSKGIQGFRLDAPLHYYGDVEKNNEFLSWLNTTVKEIKGDAFIVGEVWSDQKTIESHYESEIDSFFNFPASFTDGKIVTNIRSKNGSALAKYFEKYNASIKSINENAVDSVFLSNHDQARSAGFFSANQEQSKLMVSTFLLSPGNVFIYYGEEIGMLGSGVDPNKRLPMQWDLKDPKKMTNNPIGADYKDSLDTDVNRQNNDPDSLLNHYRKVAKVRNKYKAISNGSSVFVDFDNSSIYAMKHNLNDESILVIHNFSDEKQEIILEEKIKEVNIIDINLKSTVKNEQISIQPYSSIVISIER